MEFLVTMTTHVPGGTSDAAVAEVRQREAAHSHDLAEHGNLLRLWRPPLNPGEWRTLGLFAARDADELETVLASMPLRVWRTDETEQLSPHPNDPALSGAARGPEFLVTMALAIPDGTPSTVVADRSAREAERAHELSGQGHLRRLWTTASQTPVSRILGLWSADDLDELDDILQALPLHDWMAVASTPLSLTPVIPACSAERHHRDPSKGGPCRTTRLAAVIEHARRLTLLTLCPTTCRSTCHTVLPYRWIEPWL